MTCESIEVGDIGLTFLPDGRLLLTLDDFLVETGDHKVGADVGFRDLTVGHRW